LQRPHILRVSISARVARLGEPPLALDQRQAAQVVAVMLDQVEGERHRLMSPAFAPQCAEVRHPVVAGRSCGERFALTGRSSLLSSKS
jgi:hypothetical protein